MEADIGGGHVRMLRRYWFTFEDLRKPTPLNMGCGVTAYDRDDAMTLLQENVFAGERLPAIASLVEDADVSALDHKHVLPNIGRVEVRGIWFPQGYQDGASDGTAV